MKVVSGTRCRVWWILHSFVGNYGHPKLWSAENLDDNNGNDDATIAPPTMPIAVSTISTPSFVRVIVRLLSQKWKDRSGSAAEVRSDLSIFKETKVIRRV